MGVEHVFGGTEFIIKHGIPQNFGKKTNLYLGRMFPKGRYHPYVTSQTFPAPLMSKLLPEMTVESTRFGT